MALPDKHVSNADLDRESAAGAMILGIVVGLAMLGIVYLIFFSAQNSVPDAGPAPLVSVEGRAR